MGIFCSNLPHMGALLFVSFTSAAEDGDESLSFLKIFLAEKTEDVLHPIGGVSKINEDISLVNLMIFHPTRNVWIGVDSLANLLRFNAQSQTSSDDCEGIGDVVRTEERKGQSDGRL